jgi:hypothetical protein
VNAHVVQKQAHLAILNDAANSSAGSGHEGRLEPCAGVGPAAKREATYTAVAGTSLHL